MRWIVAGALAYFWAFFHFLLVGEEVPFLIYILFVILFYALLERIEVVHKDETTDEEGEK